MTEYQVVNATQLDEDLATIAESIRYKKGTTDFLAFPRGMVQAIYTIPGQKEEQEKTAEIITGKDVIKEIIPDEGKVLNKTNIQIKIDENEILNRWGMEDFSLDTFVYNKPTFSTMGKFYGTGINKIYLPNINTVSVRTFSLSNVEIFWLGSVSSDTFNNGEPNKIYRVGQEAFMGSNFNYFVINTDQDPVSAFICDLDAFKGASFETGDAILYVPNNKVTLWEEAIYGSSISNFLDYPTILPISELPEEVLL